MTPEALAHLIELLQRKFGKGRVRAASVRKTILPRQNVPMPGEKRELDAWIGWLVGKADYNSVRAVACLKNINGRPEKLVRISYFGFTLAIDEMAGVYSDRGFSFGLAYQSAFSEALEIEKLERIERADDAKRKGEFVPSWHRYHRAPRVKLETLKDYYRKGARELRDSDIRTAKRVALLASTSGISNNVMARSHAVAQVALELGQTVWLIERRLDRASRKRSDRFR
jgi:hypothetical protein